MIDVVFGYSALGAKERLLHPRGADDFYLALVSAVYTGTRAAR